MSISASPSPKYVGQALLMGIACLALGLWGAYDLWVTIPHREQAFEQYQRASTRLKELEEAREDHRKNGTQPSALEAEDYTKASADLQAVTPGGKAPLQPSKYDKPVQWMYIACLPFAAVVFMNLARVLPQRYRLDDEGGLHFKGDKQHGAGVWAANEMADIDMNRWMRKSVAWVVRSDAAGGIGAAGGADGRGRLKLDAYHHRNLDKIVGALASRFHPEQWDEQARPVKPRSEGDPEANGEALAQAEASENPASAA